MSEKELIDDIARHYDDPEVSACVRAALLRFHEATRSTPKVLTDDEIRTMANLYAEEKGGHKPITDRQQGEGRGKVMIRSKAARKLTEKWMDGEIPVNTREFVERIERIVVEEAFEAARGGTFWYGYNIPAYIKWVWPTFADYLNSRKEE